MGIVEIEKLLTKTNWVEVRCSTQYFDELHEEIQKHIEDQEFSKDIRLSTHKSFCEDYIKYTFFNSKYLTLRKCTEFDDTNLYPSVITEHDSPYSLRSAYPQIILPITGEVIDMYLDGLNNLQNKLNEAD